ncbi:ABC transporter A family member 10 [Thecamonas trahens ATCC 50062]|uniref:ABC transporter A family member 10 n=1 Tax=Thecamonas trahens ATCC 50062 TaxID=461836 RepID=A0A0L0D3F0_THETB|nr:ABC transporter A family member 10 [Thecamonas trahens ATCC 50062]KNC46862.1 ABC transporter A family member 10 [Thecamonas trahens ATCC 50062]|eukprot:XP_013760135.1 ABC transporter A family member 10 [Thecamonas trahens ATCC 50062]
MKIMGLKSLPYWLVNYFFGYALYFVFSMFFWILAAILGFRYWTLNSPAAIFLLLFIWGHVLMSLVFLLQVFFSKAQSASIGGYLFIFSVGLLASTVVRQYLYQPETPRATIVSLSLFPPFAFYRGLVILSQGVSFSEPGLKWKNINNDQVRLGEVFAFLIFEWLFLMLVSIYLEAVYTTSYGIKRKPLFFLDKAFWCPPKDKTASTTDAYAATPIAPSKAGEPEDVAAERTRVASGDFFDLRCADLSKTYPGRNGQPPKEACAALALGVSAGECFGFLGPNGAGKSTTISMISGLFGPTSGTAHVCGYDINTDIDLVHLNMGVCPQEDLLWDDLTGPEHLRFYGRLKNLSGTELTAAVDQVLEAVALNDKTTRAKVSSEYSGGMKRRLSVACALIGSPRILLLDEPSTGLDPASRQKLWDVILQYKSKCAMLLTTHSMHEADALCDRIGIFVNGEMKTIGSAPQLKFRYGKGYKLSVISSSDTVDDVIAYVESHIPSATVLNTLSGTTNFEVSKDAVALHRIFAAFDAAPDSLAIHETGVANSSLEEVFLKITDKYVYGKADMDLPGHDVPMDAMSYPTASSSSSDSTDSSDSPSASDSPVPGPANSASSDSSDSSYSAS